MKDIYEFVISRKKFVLVPIIVVLIIISAMAIFASSTAVAPLVYSLF
jgi:competence protein ComGC